MSAMDAPNPLSNIRQDIQSMHAYAIQDSAGMVKLDAMENPFALPTELQKALGERLGAVAIHRYPGARIDDLKQALAQRLLQLGRQAVRVLHRIELDHAGRFLDRIGVHAQHVLADAFQKLGTDGAHRGSLIGGTGDSRNSAARAWACRPSP